MKGSFYVAEKVCINESAASNYKNMKEREKKKHLSE